MDGHDAPTPTLDLRPKRYCTIHGESHAEADWTEHCERYTGSAPIRFCKHSCGGWHPLDRWPANCMPERNLARSDLARPHIISDTLPGNINGMRSMHDGKRYDSKSRYYRSLREGGAVIVGNEEVPDRRETNERLLDREIGQTVKDAIEELRNGVLSDDQMGNMLREKHESQGGFHVE